MDIAQPGLTFGAAGDEVGRLQAALTAVGFEVDAAERTPKLFGASTTDAVRKLQTLFSLPPTGAADAVTLGQLAAAMQRLGVTPSADGRVAVDQFAVQGVVHDAADAPAAGVTVVASHRDLRTAHELGRATTGAQGTYRIAYTAAQLQALGVPSADLEVQVLAADGTALLTSGISFAAPRYAQIDLALGRAPDAKPSEFAVVRANVQPLLGALSAHDIVENERHKDVSFLAEQTGTPPVHLSFFAAAARLAATTQLAPELFYALFRQNVPADAAAVVTPPDGALDLDAAAQRLASGVLATGASVRAQAVDSALRANLVPAAYAAQAPAELARLDDLAKDAALTAPRGASATSLGAVLSAAAVPPGAQRAFAELRVTGAAPSAAPGTAPSAQPGALVANAALPAHELDAAQFATTVADLTGGDLALVAALTALHRDGTYARARDLARLSANDWKALLAKNAAQRTNGTPTAPTAASQAAASQVAVAAPGAGAADAATADAYAKTLESSFASAYPSAAFAARLAEDPQSPLPAHADVAAFLAAHPDFDVTRSNVDAYLAGLASAAPPGAPAAPQAPNAVAPTATPAASAALRASLLTAQRLAKLAPSYAVAKPLLDGGLHSAQQIYALGRSRFVDRFAGHPDVGATQAARVYANAEQTYAAALTLVANVNGAFAAATPAALGTPLASAAAGQLASFPNLQTLFGPDDWCACQECRSVLGPAAYLTDLLSFLHHRAAIGGGTAKDVLLARRPDLAQIELSCANTNGALPYIDLVNELLEDAVAPPPDRAAAARARQTTLTTSELDANPQYVNAAAYAKLSTALSPWTLPFDLPLAEMRTYLGQLGLDRTTLMRTFQKPVAPPSSQASALAAEALGLGALEADLIAGGSLPSSQRPAWEYWGLAQAGNTIPDPLDPSKTVTGGYLDVLAQARVLLARAGLTYRELTRLFNTVYLNGDGALTIACDPPDSCNVATMTIGGLASDPARLMRFMRFVRLWRRLGWDVYDLDDALSMRRATSAPGADPLDGVLLRQLAAVAGFARRSGTPVAAALALFGPIPTRDVPTLPGDDVRFSVYHGLFADRTVLNPVDPVFTLGPAGFPELAEINTIAAHPRLADHRTALTAAFELIDAELDLAIARFTDGMLTVANLSAIYRRVLLARALGVSVRELIVLLALVESPLDAVPFFAPVDPFAPAVPESLAAFEDAAGALGAAGFTTAQADWLLRGIVSVTGVAPDDVTAGTLLRSLRNGLASIVAQTDAERRDRGARQIAHDLAEALDLPVPTAALLAGAWLTTPATGARLIDDLLALPSIPRDPALEPLPVARGEAGFAASFDAYARLAKTAAIVTALNMSTPEVAWWRDNGVALGWLDPTQLPPAGVAAPGGAFAKLRRLIDAAGVRDAMPPDGTPATALADLARNGASKADYLAALAKRTGWRTSSLRVLCGDPANAADRGALGLAYPDDYRSERALARLVPAFAMLRRTGIPADAAAWTGATVTPAQADAVKQAVKARYPAEQWPALAKPLRDVLRERQRDALVAYLLANPPAGVSRWRDPNDVYAYFLIDVGMCACQETSRIVQATATVQLFVQRCFLNLEPAVSVNANADGDWLQWRWMSGFRTWQANRQVFLYPENWIEPGLRNDKSPLFAELERELLQSDVSADLVESALEGYIRKLESIARLDVCGLFHDVAGGVDVLHVVARSQGSPPVYWYRSWVDNTRWTAWTKIDVDISGDHVMPLVLDGKLYVFWAIVASQPDRTLTALPTPATQPPAKPRTHLEITLAWTRLRGDAWDAKKTGSQVLILRENLDPVGIAMRASFNDKGVVFDVYSDNGSGNSWGSGEFWVTGTGNGVEAYLLGASANMDETSAAARGIGTRPNYGPPGLWPLAAMRLAFNGMTQDPGSTTASGSRMRVSQLNTKWYGGGDSPSQTLLQTVDAFTLTLPHQRIVFDSSLPFFYGDAARAYFLVPSFYAPVGTPQPPIDGHPTYRISSFYHAFAPLFARELARGGPDALYARAVQTDPATVAGVPPFDFNAYYQPSIYATPPFPGEGVDFNLDAGYALYNWELFYHVPFLVAEALARNRRFAEAKRWYEYVFNPTSSSGEQAPQRYWITKPFFAMTAADDAAQRIAGLMQALNAHDPVVEHQVGEWRKFPFDPHVIAGLRPVAYQRAIVMKYVDNLIAWGDELFAQDTIEGVNAATQLYVLAAELLGPRPELIEPRVAAPAKTYADLESSLDDFSDAVVAAENTIPPVTGAPLLTPPGTPALPTLRTFYFRIPPNDKLLSYWDTVADRLFKIRHCMNLAGVARELPLFAPPVDPALIVKAAAAGLDLGSVLSDTGAPAPPYRFATVVRQALEICDEVRALGNELLSALEKRDGEHLAVLRSSRERQVQAAMQDVRSRQIDEANEGLVVLDRSRDVTLERRNFYRDVAYLNLWEIASLAAQGLSIVSDTVGVVLESASGAAHMAPGASFGIAGLGPLAAANYGGENVGFATTRFAKAARIASAILHTGAAMSAVVGGYQRRADDWALQRRLADLELDHIAAERVAAEIRADVARGELTVAQKQAAEAGDVDAFLQTKYTNEELYDWMVGQTSATYFQAYQLAYGVAKQAERAFRRELAVDDTSFVRFGSWDSLRKGLTAGDKLAYDLRRMEAEYQRRNERELEITKHVSLAAIDPYALVELRSTGSCTVTLPELFFGLDNPGHYLRRLKTVGVSVPCVVGPYGSVSLTLTQLDNQVRVSADLAGGYARAAGTDVRFRDAAGGTSQIVTSTGQNDGGMFELRLDDPRYLPFENAGAVGSWRLTLNPVFPQFDYATITDVVLHLRFTARSGGAAFAAQAAAAVKAQLNAIALAENRQGLYRMFSARHEYGTNWYRFLSPGAATDQVLTMETPPDRFAFFTHGMSLEVNGIDVLSKTADAGDYELIVTPPGGTPQSGTLAADATLGGVHHWSAVPLAPLVDLGRAPSTTPAPTWTFKLRKAGAPDFRSLTPGDLDDLVVILRYHVS